mmetsp:Transcript_42513/g.64054  ORF Transcript_42513/g.64054 Transcript_42513/m.64054 type:complete len:85 (+) Transcript_42513:219-473(+)
MHTRRVKNQTKNVQSIELFLCLFRGGKVHSFFWGYNADNEHQTTLMSRQTTLDCLFQKGGGGCMTYAPLPLTRNKTTIDDDDVD